MVNPEPSRRALDGAAAVVTTAAGYPRHGKDDSAVETQPMA
jgi:hypothetical protein